MTGDQFIAALKGKIEPRTIIGMKGESTGVRSTLSDGSEIMAERKKIAALRSDAEMAAYVVKVLG